MTAADLLAHLESLGIAITAAEGKLRVSAARDQLTGDLKSAIAAHKPELLALLAERSPASLDPRPIPRTGALPVSFFQERLWILSKFEPESTAFNMVASWSSSGPVDIDHAQRALRAIVERHELLRARFQDDDSVPSVVLASPDAVPIEVRDLRGQSIDAQWEAFMSAVSAASHQPFDLTTQTPVRFTIFRGDDDRIGTLIAAHHIAVDAWSIGVLTREISAAYDGVELPPLALQYPDYAAWQRATHDTGDARAQLHWWKERLAGAPPVSMVPPDRPRSPRAEGNTRDYAFGTELTAGLHALAREEGATVYMALAAACAAMLNWYTGQDDIIIGSPMGIRERPEFEGIVGPFVNVLLLRFDLSDDPTLAQLLHRARGAVLDAHAHRDVSFERLVQHVNPVRSLDHDPLFQVAVVYHTAAPSGDAKISGGGAIFDLTWFAREVDGRLSSGLEYRSDIYSPETIDGVFARLEGFLAAAVENRHRRLSELSLVTPTESARVLAFNATERALDPAPFVEQFERQAAATPHATAVSFDGVAWSYAELDARANQIAHHLRSLGVSPGVVVALGVQRSLDMVAALVGVHKAAGIYLPLDPDFPAERLSFMLADSGARLVLTSGAMPRDVEVPAGVTLVNLAEHAERIAAQPTTALGGAPAPSDTAYIIYTSGSTGRPKGVLVSHAALSNFLGSMRHEPGIGPGDTLAAVTTLSFDIAALELYLPLIAGARVVLVARDVAVDGARLAHLLMTEHATLLQATPATWRLLVEAGWTGAPGFRALIGGEALPPELAEMLLPRVAELWNMYGPTETTVWSTVSRVRPDEPITIGRPIANTRVYVLDRARRLVPVGVAGELWIGGDGVAIGYHARPELTDERFVADPFVPAHAGARMYRTGDRARWRSDGTLEHLGRLDHQLKVRGYRIEPGEIEATLEAHDAVRQAVVMARKPASGDVRLVAYLTYEPGEDLSASEVRRLVRDRLPDYMVPSLFVTLDAMPLTPNGKVDRNALPDPFVRGATAQTPERTPPAPGLETELADIWRSVLQTRSVSAEDNFFDLGGHSLLALRVASAVHKRTGWRMDPRLLFFQQLRQIAAAAPAGAAVEHNIE